MADSKPPPVSAQGANPVCAMIIGSCRGLALHHSAAKIHLFPLDWLLVGVLFQLTPVPYSTQIHTYTHSLFLSFTFGDTRYN